MSKKMLERANQPHAYILADVERAEREVTVANKKIKAQEEDLKRAKKDIESLSIVRYISVKVFSKNVVFRMI